MKKLIILSLVLVITSCGRSSFTKSSSNTLDNNATCSTGEVCSVKITSKDPLRFSFSTSAVSKGDIYSAYRYDDKGNQFELIRQIVCSESTACSDPAFVGNNLNQAQNTMTINTNGYFIRPQDTVRVFKR